MFPFYQKLAGAGTAAPMDAETDNDSVTQRNVLFGVEELLLFQPGRGAESEEEP